MNIFFDSFIRARASVASRRSRRVGRGTF